MMSISHSDLMPIRAERSDAVGAYWQVREALVTTLIIRHSTAVGATGYFTMGFFRLMRHRANSHRGKISGRNSAVK